MTDPEPTLHTLLHDAWELRQALRAFAEVIMTLLT